MINALQRMQFVSSVRSTLPILSNVLLKIDDDKKLWITGTDLDICVKASVNLESLEKKGSTTLPLRRILGIFKELPADIIELDINEQNIAVINANNTQFSILGLPENAFPQMPSVVSDKKIIIKQSIYKDILQATHYAAAIDDKDSNLILSGVYNKISDDKITAAATDVRRIVVAEHQLQNNFKEELDFILPYKSVLELINALQSTEDTVTITLSSNLVSFEFPNLLIISKLLEGTYPDVKQVFPNKSEEGFIINREKLLWAIRRACLVATEKVSVLKLTFSDNQLEIINETPMVGQAREILSIACKGKNFTVGFNSEYLMDPLRNLKNDDIYIEMADVHSPIVIKTDMPFMYLLMPIREKRPEALETASKE